MPDFDIDHLKKSWQEQNVSPKYESNDILEMLNRKSRNYVKYILWISIAEFVLLLIVNIFYITESSDNASFLNIVEKIGIKKTSELTANFDRIYLTMKYVSLAVTAIFVVLFYISYKKIRVEENLKKLILQIIRFKKTVNAFILTNILLLILFTLTLLGFVYLQINHQHVVVNHSTFTGFIVGSIVAILLSVLLMWAYYRLVYGIIMNMLGKNLAQLKEIESDSKE